MTQPSTSAMTHSLSTSSSDSHLGNDESMANQQKDRQLTAPPAILHPNFDPNNNPPDPDRPLSDIPNPVRHHQQQLSRLYGQGVRIQKVDPNKLSKWALIESDDLAEYLALLSAGQLIDLPDSFYTNHSEQPLLSPLRDMPLLDMTDIQSAIQAYPNLTRYGFKRDLKSGLKGEPNNGVTQNQTKNSHLADHQNNQFNHAKQTASKLHDSDELLNSDYADDWEVVLFAERFDTGMGNLITDILPCSVAVHILSQCPTRKSINTSYSVSQICQHMRAYLLSQIRQFPAHRLAYRQTPLFAGHIIVACHYLGWDIQVSHDDECHINISSRCGLLARYPNIQEYYINGWFN